MLDDDIQRELLRDTVDPERSLSIAVNMEMGHENQQRISSNNNNASGSAINAIQSFKRFRGANTRGNQTGRITINQSAIGQCRGCGQNGLQRIVKFSPLWVRNAIILFYSTISQSMSKNSNNTRNSHQDNRINNVENSKNTEQNVNSENQFKSEYDSSDDNYVAMVEDLNTPPIALQNMTIKIGNTDWHLLLRSGSGCTIISMSRAKDIMFNCMQAQWSEKKPLELKSFSNDIVETLGTLRTPVLVTIGKFKKQTSRYLQMVFDPSLDVISSINWE